MSEFNKVNWRGPLILAVSLFVLGSFAYWMEYKKKPDTEEKEAQAKKLFVLKDTAVQGVRIVNGKRAFALKCMDLEAKLCKPGDNSKWELAEPKRLRADDGNVNSFISTLNNINVSETIDLKEETPAKRAALLKEYGLDPISIAQGRFVEVTTTTGTSSLYLGLPHPIGESVFALKGDGHKAEENKVYLVPSYFKSNFDKELTHWRDKKVLSVAASEIEAFTIEGGKAGKLTGDKKDAQWVLSVKNEQYPGDYENVETLLSAVAFLSAKDFAADDRTERKAKALLRGAKPVLKMTLAREKAEPLVLTLYSKGRQPQQLFATVSNLDPLFELDASATDRLDKSLKDLRMAKLMTSMERFTAKKLVFSGVPMGKAELTLINQEGKWLSQSDKKEQDADGIQKMLDKLSGSRIKEFLTGKQIPGGESEGLRITVGDEKSDAKRQVLFWKKDGKLYARDLLSKRPEVFLMDTVVQDHLPWKPDHFLKK